MVRHKKKKLVYQFLSFILPFIILSIVITSVILSLTNYNFFQKTIKQDYANILKSSAGEIRLFMDNAQRNLESLALLMAATKLDSWQKEIALTAFLHINTQFVSIDLFSADGKKIVSTISESPASNSADPEIFGKALSGKVSVSGVKLAKNDIPHMHLAVPVFRLGNVKEVLWAQLNLKSIWDVLEGITIGDTGQVYIMDLSGRYIAHRQIDRVLRSAPTEKPDVLRKIHGAKAPVEWTDDEDGSTSYNLGVYVPGLDWVVVLSQPSTEIFAYLYRNLFWAVLMTVLICIVTVFLAWRWVRRFLVPIKTLHQQVQVIGQGNMDQKVSINSEDEIGDLGMAFNEMTDSLKEYIVREVEAAKALAHSKNLAILGTASSKVTHEVGNFLNNTHMALSGLKRENLSHRGEKILKIIEKDSTRVNEFIHKILQFAKKPVLHLQKSPIDLIIREILEITGPEAEKRGIKITLNWDAEIPVVNIDPGLMSQVFNNLLKNSMDAMPDTGLISINESIENKDLVISVADTGEGIDNENLEKIFEPFFTTKGSKGTGLGMPIVKTNVEAHGGTIECRSELKKGTTFIIRLPI
jgi:two-component system NtrC family sensor kinase